MTYPETPSMTTASQPDISTFDGNKDLEATHQNMVDAGVAVETRQTVDYWSFKRTEKWYLPGQDHLPEGVRQYVLFERMTEEKKVEFQTKTNRDIRVQSTTKDIKMNMNPAHERQELLRISIVGWYLFKPNHKGELVEIGYSDKERAAFIRQADPYLIQKLEEAIRNANPWMRAELTAAEIKVEIANLTEQLAEAEAREEAK